jgi:cobalt-zinc-cadmium efflux system outer membrane protein
VAQERVEAIREVAGRFQALLEVVVQRDPAGVAPLLDTRIIEANTLTLERRASQAAQEWQAALLELNQLRDQPPAMVLRLAASPSVGTNLPASEVLLETARTNNFELRARRLELVQQGFQVDLSRNERWPRVTLAPFYSEEKAADAERIAGVGVTVPLPVWHQNGGNIEAAQARLRQAEAALQAAYRQVERKVTEHSLAIQAKLGEMSRWRKDASEQFRQAAELADRHYRLGAVPVTMYVEMQLRYLEALDALLATRSETLEQSQQLELLVGRPLEGLTTR